MNRLEFLKSAGFKGAALMAVLQSCVNAEDTYISVSPIAATDANGNPTSGLSTTTPTISAPVAITGNVTTEELNKITSPLLKIDLTTTGAKSLQSIGGYIIQSKIVVARTAANAFAAATQTCTHEPKNKIIYSQGEFYCTDHGARFSVAGQPLNTITRIPIAIYKTATDGKTLLVY